MCKFVYKVFLNFCSPYRGSRGEWNGKYSDGSIEMTSDLMNELGHKNADDGTFWMDFVDFCTHWDKLEVCKQHLKITTYF